MAVLRRHFCAECASPVLYVTSGHPRSDFDIFAVSGDSTSLVLLLKTRSRPIGVRVCPLVQFNFFSTAFDPREWTIVVFWKEDSGRQIQLITPETKEEMRLALHHHQDFSSLMTLMFLLVRGLLDHFWHLLGDNGNGPDHLIEYILAHKRHKRHRYLSRSLLLYRMRIPQS